MADANVDTVVEETVQAEEPAPVTVRVYESLEECPAEIIGYLEAVREAIDQCCSGKIKKCIWGKKAIGVMSVTFKDGTTETIAALSGQGVSPWTLQEVHFNNGALYGLKAQLAEMEITLAPLTYEHPEYQRLQDPAEVLPLEAREVFAEEYITRFKRKVKRLKEANLTHDQLVSALRKSPEYRPDREEDFLGTIVPCYWRLASDSDFCTRFCTEIKEILESKVPMKEYCRTNIRNSEWEWAFQKIERYLEVADPPPSDVDDVINRIITRYEVDGRLLSMFCIALGWWTPRDPRTARQADMTVQCAEDNALAELKNLRKGRTVVKLMWVAVTVTATKAAISYKPLCAFCQVAFHRRASSVNRW